ncbi:TetR family transcriptional regulator [Pectobacterium actinidiae]|uniref:TetR family transcriptional regulator n=1 Tax=Pectobacterium actinidiae TaxID=1507808 RepID=UPI002A82FCBF|nr:TetR family transcriptional regulator [Pectobacterium actinidiae]MDY4316887.1 TetR family transcriptional regulator [Pectobacterium actinidiae]
MGLRQTKKDQTRSQLVEAAFTLIEKQGFQQTTINEIAAAVNVSPRTFLRYFPTKDDVVVGWLDFIMAVLPSTLAQGSADEPIADALMRSARAMVGTYQTRGSFLNKIEDIITTSPTLQMRKQQRIEALVEDVSDALAGVYGTRYSPLALDLYAGVAVSLCRAAIREWIRTGGQEEILAILDRAAGKVNMRLISDE